jgi:hypothetical protein
MGTEGDNIRALIRMIPPARALRQELKAIVASETFDGVGKLAVRNFTGLLKSIMALTGDGDYLATLSVESPGEGGAGDKEQVMAVLLSLSQLIAYLEGQAGLPASGAEEQAKDMRNYATNDSSVRIDFSGSSFKTQGQSGKSPVDPDTLEKLIGGERGKKVADMLRSVFEARAKQAGEAAAKANEDEDDDEE